MLKIISSKVFLWIIVLISALIWILIWYLNWWERNFSKAENIIKWKQDPTFLKWEKKNIIIAPSKLDF